MLEDMWAVSQRLEQVTVRLTPASREQIAACPGASDPEAMLESHLGVVTLSLRGGQGGQLTVQLAYHPDHMARIPPELRRRCEREGINLRPVLFQQGVNEMQTIANTTNLTGGFLPSSEVLR